MRILLVEDDQMLGQSMQVGLSQEGFAVDWVRDGEAALLAARTHLYAALLLDLGLPRRDGLSVLKSLRASGSTIPVLVVSARDHLTDRVDGLNAGADDFILKPFDLAELVARMHAVTRRVHGRTTSLLRAQGVTLDTAARRVSLDGAAVDVTAREFAIIQFLMERVGRIVTRSELESALFQWSAEVESNVVEVYVSQIRRKLGRDFIVTKRGLGYCIDHGDDVPAQNTVGR
jgi:two-component system response regulator QseB